MAIAEILTCRFCRRDFESEIARGRKPTVCPNCSDIGLTSRMQAERRPADALRSANPEVDAGVLYRHGSPLYADALREYNRRVLARPLSDVARDVAERFLAAG
jgi:hypothetical protein